VEVPRGRLSESPELRPGALVMQPPPGHSTPVTSKLNTSIHPHLMRSVHLLTGNTELALYAELSLSHDDCKRPEYCALSLPRLHSPMPRG
jgi:hypothetical protein